MKKIFGFEIEFNITTDDDLVKGISKGVEKCSVAVGDILKNAKPEILDFVKKFFSGKEEKITKE